MPSSSHSGSGLAICGLAPGRSNGPDARIQVQSTVKSGQKKWAYLDGVELDFSRPGKPTDNAFIESFNGRFRQECLNENWFLALEDAREEVESWRNYYNGERPHIALGNLSPREFAVLAEIGD